jgi:hypothetical protein
MIQDMYDQYQDRMRKLRWYGGILLYAHTCEEQLQEMVDEKNTPMGIVCVQSKRGAQST